jgi:hypothetical protein
MNIVLINCHWLENHNLHVIMTNHSRKEHKFHAQWMQIDMRGRSHIALAYDGSLLLKPSRLFGVRKAQVGEHDRVLLREQLGLGLNDLDFKSSLCEVDEGSTCGLFLAASSLILLGQCLLLLCRHHFPSIAQCKCRSVTFQIALGGFVAPLARLKGTIGWAFLLDFSDRRCPSPS